MKRILVIHYSQTGQLTRILRSMLAPLEGAPGIELVWWEIRAKPPFPFPWPIPKFLNAFPESVLMEPCELEPLPPDGLPPVDLVILAYQVWYLAPSIPISAFLRSPHAAALRGKPVITVVNGRDKWLSAQERVKEILRQLGATLIDNVAFIHEGTPFQHTVTTLRWLWFGKKEAFGSFPAAGVSEADIQNAPRFGLAIRRALEQGAETGGQPMLRGLGAVEVDGDTILQEGIARPIFRTWAKIVRAAGRLGLPFRALALLLFGASLACLLVLAAPIVLVYRIFFAPFLRERTAQRIAYYEQPSGSSTEKTAGAEPGAMAGK